MIIRTIVGLKSLVLFFFWDDFSPISHIRIWVVFHHKEFPKVIIQSSSLWLSCKYDIFQKHFSGWIVFIMTAFCKAWAKPNCWYLNGFSIACIKCAVVNYWNVSHSVDKYLDHFCCHTYSEPLELEGHKPPPTPTPIKRTEARKDNLLMLGMPPTNFWTFQCPWYNRLLLFEARFKARPCLKAEHF